MSTTLSLGLPYLFKSLASTPNPYDGPYTYTWNFGDGASGSGQNIQYAYSSLGNVTAKVTAVNSKTGFAAQAQKDYTIVNMTTLPNANYTRYMGTSITLNDGRVLIAGGLSSGFNSTTDNSQRGCELFNPATGAFTTTGMLNQGRARIRLAKLPNGDILCAGGSDAISGSSIYPPANNNHLVFNTCEVYSISSGTWSYVNPMANTRCCYGLSVLPSGKIMVLGGVNRTNYLQSTEIYDPVAGTWSAGPNIPITVTLFACADTPTGFVMTGGAIGDNSFTNRTFKYSEGGAFVEVAANPQAGFLTAFASDGTWLYIAHPTGAGYFGGVYRYNLQGNTWETLTPTPVPGWPPTVLTAACILNGMFVTAGGVNSINVNRTALVEVRSPGLTTLADLGATIDSATMFSAGGRVYVLGGTSTGPGLSTVYQY